MNVLDFEAALGVESPPVNGSVFKIRDDETKLIAIFNVNANTS